MRLGLAITTYARPNSAAELADSAKSWTLPPDRIVIADNSPGGVPPCSADVLRSGANDGLPAAVGACLTALADCDAVLVLDDDTVLADDTSAEMVAALGGGVGVVGVPRRFTRKTRQRGRQLFPWSPSLVTRAAVEAVGLPRSELFFGLDDWDYGVRVARAGLSVEWLDVDLPQQSLAESWDGRTYLTARNATYLAVWANRDPVFWRTAWAQARTALRPGRGAGLRRRGIRDGLLRRMGAPPADLLPS